MLYFFTPYSFTRRLFDAYDQYINLMPSDDDWACILDGDTAFLRSDFGHQIEEYIKRFPTTGLFTCYASRCWYDYQRPLNSIPDADSILRHKAIADKQKQFHEFEAEKLNKKIAGHLIVIQKKTWLALRDEVALLCRNETIEGVDTFLSKALLASGRTILLMKGLYIFHYFRLLEGSTTRKHLGYGNFLNIITPCSRPENLHSIAESINIPRNSYQWFVVFDAKEKSVDKKFIPENATVIYHQDPRSKVGHAQRNIALRSIKNGYVYFLDDDTLLHPALYKSIEHLKNDFIHFDQANPDGSKRIGGIVKVNHIDTGSAVVLRSLIADIRFQINLYNADGHFWVAMAQKANNVKYIQKTLSIYNALNP